MEKSNLVDERLHSEDYSRFHWILLIGFVLYWFAISAIGSFCCNSWECSIMCVAGIFSFFLGGKTSYWLIIVCILILSIIVSLIISLIECASNNPTLFHKCNNEVCTGFWIVLSFHFCVLFVGLCIGCSRRR